MKAAIFDVDGTLTDSVDLHAKAWQEAFEYFGHPIPFEKIRSQIGKGGDQLIPVFLPAEEIQAKAKELETYRGDLFKRNFLSKVRSFPKVRELFQRLLEDEWKLALASTAKKEELRVYKDICRISDLLDTETSSDDAGESKPDPDIFQAAMKRLGGIPSAECVVVGDSPFDALAASKAGVRAIGFLSGGFPKEDLLSAGFETLYWGVPDVFVNYEESFFYRESPRKE